jgi:hypothetical protein
LGDALEGDYENLASSSFSVSWFMMKMVLLHHIFLPCYRPKAKKPIDHGLETKKL